MTKLDGALVNLLGVKPTYMRPPFISFNSEVVDVMTKMGYRIVNCDVDSQDWNNLTPEESLARVEAAGRATADGQGHVLLMHDPIESTSKELALMVIKWAKANKLKMVTVAECLGDHLPYTRGKGTKERTC